MPNSRIVFDNVFDLANIVAVTSEAGNLVAENLQDYSPAKVWRSTSAVVQAITVDLYSNKEINCIGLWNTNATTSGSMQIRGGVDPTFATTLYNVHHTMINTDFDFDNAESYPFMIVFLSSTINARHWKFDITDTGNPDGYIEAGRLVMGKYIETDKNAAFGKELTIVDPSQIVRTRGGVWRSNNQTPFRKLALAYQFMSDSESDDILLGRFQRGRQKDVLVSVYPEESSVRERDNTILGVMTDWSGNVDDFLGINSVRMAIEESI